eukprot:scaffold25018_cov86-Skeletonema_dohrnii-CCMP3373.AAC.3
MSTGNNMYCGCLDLNSLTARQPVESQPLALLFLYWKLQVSAIRANNKSVGTMGGGVRDLMRSIKCAVKKFSGERITDSLQA